MAPNPKNPAILMLDTQPTVVAGYSSVGGYPLFYMTADGGVLSPKSVQENLDLCCEEDDPQWFVIAHEANYENNELTCDHSGEAIETAY